MRWPHLFSPLALGPLVLPNRIIMPGMDPSLASPDGGVTDVMVRHYRERAAGGAGLIITGNVACTRGGRLSPWMPLLHDDALIPGFERLARAAHAVDGRLFVQLSHAGRQTLSDFAGAQPVSASAIPCPVMRETPRALDEAEVPELAEAFAAAAARVQAAGADGVEFHMAHGYLVCQFLSPYSNHRTDRWGLDAAGRVAFAVEILRRTRARVGPDFPLQCRLSADERVEGGISPPLCLTYALALAEAGATSFSISACNYESYRYNMPSYYLPEATYADLAAFVRSGLRAAGQLQPVVAVGRFRRGDVAERALAAGQADAIAMGRALIAEPALPRLLARDRELEARPCVACNRCAESVTVGPIRCLVNPGVGRDAPAAESAAPGRRVLVVGGGPAGVTAAVEAARRGFSVRLVEAADQLGGKAWASAAPPEKAAFGEYAAWLAREAREADIDVELGSALTPAEVADAPEDVVLVATGALANPAPPIAGLDTHPAVLHPEDALRDPTPRRHVLIVGGGPEGCEVADAMAHRPERPRVTLVELRPKVGLGLPTSVRALLQERLENGGVELLTRTSVGAVGPGGVSLVDRKGHPSSERPAADLIVLAIGVRAGPTWAALALVDPRVKLLGDARSPATLLEAVAEGWRVGRAVT